MTNYETEESFIQRATVATGKGDTEIKVLMQCPQCGDRRGAGFMFSSAITGRMPVCYCCAKADYKILKYMGDDTTPTENNTVDFTILAVIEDEYRAYGCPYCGYRSGFTAMHVRNAMLRICGECNFSCVVVHHTLSKSPISFGDNKFKPKVQPHPRKGLPSHGKPDIGPPDGEYFNSRGLGNDANLGCFVCGGEPTFRNNISAFVRCKDSGTRIVNMFKHGCRMDYREDEPDRVQVKIGACDYHLPNLRALDKIKSIITRQKIEEALEIIPEQGLK
jgi:hypothetical protein